MDQNDYFKQKKNVIHLPAHLFTTGGRRKRGRKDRFLNCSGDGVDICASVIKLAYLAGKKVSLRLKKRYRSVQMLEQQ